MDISTTNPVKALETYPHKNHYALVADVYSLPIKPETIDCIVASEIIEHVKDPVLFIAQLLMVLKPGGKLVITTPHDEVILQSLCIHCNSLTPHNAHLHSFTQDKIRSLVRNDIGKVETRIFNSKLLLFFKLHEKLRKLPFGLWRVIDRWAISISGKKAARLMMTIVKH
ncbi:MAG: class I SAM-dependent methyltransferase [Chitinophagales bacterium]|nr:class I SAM-dependent methyltransferase [Chitinophagales bacterium]